MIVAVSVNPHLELQLPDTIKPADRAPFYKRTVDILLHKDGGKLLHQTLKTIDNVDFLTVKYQAPSSWFRRSEVRYVKTFALTRTHTLYQLYFTPKEETIAAYAPSCTQFFSVLVPVLKE